MKGSTLVAYGFLDASVTNILLASFVALPLFDTKGNAIAGNILPSNISKVQFVNNVSKQFLLGLKNGAGAAAYELIAASQADSLDVMIPGQQVALRAFDANLTTGKFGVYFYA